MSSYDGLPMALGRLSAEGRAGAGPASELVQGGDGGPLRELDLVAQVESLLFVADEPVSIQHLAEVLGARRARVQKAMEDLRAQCADRGVRIQQNRDRVQMVTAPEAGALVERFLGLEHSGRLSVPALETLAIVVYRQPVTRAQIEAIRGVNCDGVLRTLLRRALLRAVGRLEQAGRPILYGTSMEFMQHFGLESLAQLPPLDGGDGEAPENGAQASAGGEAEGDVDSERTE